MALADGYIDATFAAGLRVHPCEFRRFVYLTNGWNRMRRWAGNWSRRVDWSGTNEFQEVPYAGITGPSTEVASWAPAPTETASVGTGWTAGLHTFRYRYEDSSTGYVSNPSLERNYTVTAASKKLSFPIAAFGSAATNMQRPDPATEFKVDTIVLEATTKNGTEFFIAGETKLTDAAGALVTALVVEKSDAELEVSLLSYLDDGHDVPPIKRWGAAHRGRFFLFGDQSYSRGTVTATENSTAVTGSGTEWVEEAIGAAGEPPIAGRRFFKGSSSEYYEIIDWVSETSIVLKDYWGAATTAGMAYEIVSGNQLIYFSMADRPESFPPLNWFSLPSGAVSGQVTAGIGFDNSMLFYTARSCYRFNWTADPGEDGSFYPLPAQRGAVSQRCVVSFQGRVYALDLLGAWVYAGGLPVDLSRRIVDAIAGLDPTYSDDWHAVAVPERREIRWFVTSSGETEPKTVLRLFLDEENNPIGWVVDSLTAAVTESHLGWISRSTFPGPFLGDENGHCWRADTGTSDGGAGYTHWTAQGGTTSSIIAVAGALPTDGSLRGVVVYWLEGNESRVVLSHTSTTLILASAFSGTPATGDNIWLGRIRAKLKTPTFYAAQGQNKMRKRCIRLFFGPLTSARKLLLRVYDHLSGTARTHGSSSFRTGASDYTHPGANADYATSDFLVDLDTSDGRVEIPLGPQAYWCSEFELEVVEPDAAFELWRIELEGYEDPSPE